jgi:iron(III) transport system permease protein
VARPAIAVGVALALLETLNDIGASEYLGVQTAHAVDLHHLAQSRQPGGGCRSPARLLLIVAALIALERYGRRRVDVAAPVQDARLAFRIALRGPARWIALTACLVPVALGFLLPAGYLAHEVIARGLLVGFEGELFRHALTTVTLASAATAITLVLGFSAVAALRYVKRPMIAACVNVAGIGYAVPGTVLALGLLSPLVLIDETINALARAFGGAGVGLMLAGSSAAVVIAY